MLGLALEQTSLGWEPTGSAATLGPVGIQGENP